MVFSIEKLMDTMKEIVMYNCVKHLGITYQYFNEMTGCIRACYTAIQYDFTITYQEAYEKCISIVMNNIYNTIKTPVCNQPIVDIFLKGAKTAKNPYVAMYSLDFLKYFGELGVGFNASNIDELECHILNIMVHTVIEDMDANNVYHVITDALKHYFQPDSIPNKVPIVGVMPDDKSYEILNNLKESLITWSKTKESWGRSKYTNTGLTRKFRNELGLWAKERKLDEVRIEFYLKLVEEVMEKCPNLTITDFKEHSSKYITQLKKV